MKLFIQKQAMNIEYHYFDETGNSVYNLFGVTVKGLRFLQHLQDNKYLSSFIYTEEDMIFLDQRQ